MRLTSHDRCVLHLAAQDAEGRLGFLLDEEGQIAVLGREEAQAVPAGDSLLRLEAEGLLSLDLSRSYVLTPQGWEVVRSLVAMAC